MKKNQIAVVGVSLCVLIFGIGFGFYYYSIAEKTAEHIATTPPSETAELAQIKETKNVLDRPEVISYLAHVQQVQESAGHHSLSSLLLELLEVLKSISHNEMPMLENATLPGVQFTIDEMNGYIFEVDYHFYERLIQSHGTPEDLAFIQYLQKNSESKIFGDTGSPYESGTIPCLDTKPDHFLAAFNEVRSSYQLLKSTPYADFFEKGTGRLQVQHLQESFSTFQCYCGSRAQVLDDLESSQSSWKGEALDEIVTKVIVEIKDNKSRIPFDRNCPGNQESNE